MIPPFNFRDWTSLRSHLLTKVTRLSKKQGLGVAFASFAIAVGLHFLLLDLIPIADRQTFTPKTTPKTTPKPADIAQSVSPQPIARSQSNLGTSPIVHALLTELPSYPNTYAGRSLSDMERLQIQQLLSLRENPATPSAPVPGEIPLVILHDTSGEFSRQTLLERQKQYQGPYGNGVAVYVLRSGEAIMTRPQFFTRYRPTATAYEKGLDLLSEKIRNQEARLIWQSLTPATRNAALRQIGSSLQTQLRISGAALAKRAAYWLNSVSENAYNALAQQGVALDGGKTTALWTIADVCEAALGDATSVTSFASSPEAATQLQSSCQRLDPLLRANRDRVSTSVNIELIQRQGSECFTTDGEVRSYNSLVTQDYLKIRANQVVPLQTSERPAYTNPQYKALTLLYLKAALMAGRYPALVTHFALDQAKGQKIGDHCDPRGLDLMRLYRLISQTLNHPPDTLYGLRPQYGINPDQGDNVWWSTRVLGSMPSMPMVGGDRLSAQ
jgi:hypothetical protein